MQTNETYKNAKSFFNAWIKCYSTTKIINRKKGHLIVENILPTGAKLVCEPYVLKDGDYQIGHILFYTQGDTLGYALGDEIRYGFDKNIVGVYVSSTDGKTILIDTFGNIATCLAVRSVFLSNADKSQDKELSILIASYDDASLLHGDRYSVFFYKLPRNKVKIPNERLEELKIPIESSCDCVGPSGKLNQSKIATATSIRRILSKKGFQQ